MSVRNLVFDLGMHHALDTEFYLKKGFDVVALEANPRLAQDARTRLAPFVEDASLTIVERALWTPGTEAVKFYVNDVKDDWSSVMEHYATKSNHDVTEIEVQTTTLDDLIALKGVPYYVKCDIEGADEEFINQLVKADKKPDYVSVEHCGVDIIGRLAAGGYNEFQIVNQANNGYTLCPNPPREGSYHDARFNGHMSGLFGLELPEDNWRSADEATELLALFSLLKKRDPALAIGWIDVHARIARRH